MTLIISCDNCFNTAEPVADYSVKDGYIGLRCNRCNLWYKWANKREREMLADERSGSTTARGDG